MNKSTGKKGQIIHLEYNYMYGKLFIKMYLKVLFVEKNEINLKNSFRTS